jgi:hypothetical protein
MIFPDVDIEVESCLYKLWYGDRFMIIKAKTLAGSIHIINKGYAIFLAAGGGRGNKKGGIGQKEYDGVNPFYFKLFRYLHRNPSFEFKIEMILESFDYFELLKQEQLLLDKCIRNKKCLNNNVQAYIPKYREKTESYGWIPNESVEAFKSYLVSNEYPPYQTTKQLN